MSVERMRLSAPGLAAREELVTQLCQIRWDVLGTATFIRYVNDSEADRTFSTFINNIERAVKANIACVHGKEFESLRYGPVGTHFHFAMKAPCGLDCDLVRNAWRKLVRRENDPADESIVVDIYDPSRRGLDYMLKMCDGYHGEYGEHRREYFQPGTEHIFDESDARGRRAKRRWLQRLALAQAEAAPVVLGCS